MSFHVDPDWLLAKASDVGLALLLFAIGWMVARTVHKLILRGSSGRDFDPALAGFLAHIARYLVLAVAIVAAMDTVGIHTTSFAALFASAGVAIGLALQGSLSNFASGVLILVLRPFDIDQVVTIAGQTGRVSDIGLFATTLVGAGNERILIPNSMVTGDVIVNLTAQSTRRAIIGVGVAYGSDVDQVVDVLRRAASRVPTVLADPAPDIRFTALGASALNFEVWVWCAPVDFPKTNHDVRKAVYEALDAAGIAIPFDQLVVHHAPTAAPPEVR